jgi:hypothetical protein
VSPGSGAYGSLRGGGVSPASCAGRGDGMHTAGIGSPLAFDGQVVVALTVTLRLEPLWLPQAVPPTTVSVLIARMATTRRRKLTVGRPLLSVREWTLPGLVTLTISCRFQFSRIGVYTGTSSLSPTAIFQAYEHSCERALHYFRSTACLADQRSGANWGQCHQNPL